MKALNESCMPGIREGSTDICEWRLCDLGVVCVRRWWSKVKDVVGQRYTSLRPGRGLLLTGWRLLLIDHRGELVGSRIGL